MLYDADYYSGEGPADNQRSAEQIVPLVMSLIGPRSVVDVGCGSGVWLALFREHGVERILGLDGAHVNPAWLRISLDSFRALDLSQPFQLNQTFDLAVCLEVAEHLPRKSAAGFTESLARIAPVILFSAAVPRQGGTNHINEQWPFYWRHLFEEQGFQMLDLIRKEIWTNPEIRFWYRQNLFLFVRKELIPSRPIFLEAAQYADDLMLIHADILERQLGIRSILRHLPKSAWRAARHIGRRFLAPR